MKRLLAIAVAAVGCSHAPTSTYTGSHGLGPTVTLDGGRIGSTREQACTRISGFEVHDVERTASQAGILAADFAAMARAAQVASVTVTFRDSNPACAPHLAAGVQSKPHAILQKTWDRSNLGPAHQDKAGLVSDLFEKPPRGTVVSSPGLTLLNGEPVTCDYDLVDEIERDGSRIPGEGPRDVAARAALNDALPDTPKGHRHRVMHGSQNAYAQYAALHPDEPELTILYRPEAPLTALGADGRVWRLVAAEDVVNFYRCVGAGIPPQWNVSVRATDGSLEPLR